jgi:hypothetical protein
MSTSDILAVALLACAIGDTLGAKYFLPKMLRQNKNITQKQVESLVGIVNIGSLLFFVAAIVIYLFKPLG